jgi:hypothetical protein
MKKSQSKSYEINLGDLFRFNILNGEYLTVMTPLHFDLYHLIRSITVEYGEPEAYKSNSDENFWNEIYQKVKPLSFYLDKINPDENYWKALYEKTNELSVGGKPTLFDLYKNKHEQNYYREIYERINELQEKEEIDAPEMFNEYVS